MENLFLLKRVLENIWLDQIKKEKHLLLFMRKIDGKKSKMGSVEFRVKEVPPPKAKVQLAKLLVVL